MTSTSDRVEIITSVQRRRHWSAAEKVRMVARIGMHQRIGMHHRGSREVGVPTASHVGINLMSQSQVVGAIEIMAKRHVVTKDSAMNKVHLDWVVNTTPQALVIGNETFAVYAGTEDNSNLWLRKGIPPNFSEPILLFRAGSGNLDMGRRWIFGLNAA